MSEFSWPTLKAIFKKACGLMYYMTLHPRETMRELIDENPWYWQKELMIAMIIFGGATPLYQGLFMMLLNIVLNGIADIGVIYITAVTIWLAGIPLGGKATLVETCTAVVWSSAPAIFISGVCMAISILGPGVYELGSTGPITFFGLPFSIFDWLQLIFVLWSCEVCLHTVAEVQGFDLKKAGLNLTLGGIAMVVVLVPPLLLIWIIVKPMLMGLVGAGGM